jgi:hypothetical protein
MNFTHDRNKRKPEQTGGANVANIINKILQKDVTESDVEKVSIDSVKNSPEFKKLKTQDKNYVLNKLNDLKNVKVQGKKDVQIKKVYFLCDNCGYSKVIAPGTKIFTQQADDLSSSYSSGNYKHMLYSDILPRTRNYTCVNPDCESHKNPEKREAVFFRLNKSYKIKYICTTCETDF